MRKTIRRGFTLVEFLVVISILTVLVALLMPSLQRVRKQGRAVLCNSNLAQMSWAVVGYCDQNRGRLFPIIHLPKMYWMGRLEPYWNGDERIIQCPETTRVSNGLGDALTMWGPGGGWMDNRAGSYGMNLWLLPDGDFATDANMIQGGYHRQKEMSPADTPVFGDSQWVGSWPDDIDTWPGNTFNPPNTHLRGFFMNRFCIDRHDDAINVGFLDGSARPVGLRELWQLRWHRQFQPGDPK